MTTNISNSDMFSNVVLRNGSFAKDISGDVITATMDLQTGQVAQLVLAVDDPNWSTFNASNLPLDAPIDFQDLALSIAIIEINAGGGQGGFTITARPRVVRNLKNAKGAHVVHNVSPTQYAQQEVAAAGGQFVGQPSAVRASIARDVQTIGQSGNSDSSAWSTLTRLANEIGFVCFECGGTIYFGKPSWFVQVLPIITVSWGNTKDTNVANAIPTLSRSLDNNGRASVSVTVPLSRAKEFRPGYGLQLTGIPRFGEVMFITQVSFPIAGDGEVTITAETPYDPEPQPAQDTSGTTGSASSAMVNNAGKYSLTPSPAPASTDYHLTPDNYAATHPPNYPPVNTHGSVKVY